MNPPASLAPGTLIGGDFRIERALQAGGMGAVYIAEQLSTGKRRALKLMHPQLVTDQKSRLRFLEEARVGSRIASDHVVEVVAAGVDDATGVPYLAMELLEGEELASVVERSGPMPHASVRELMLQLGHAIGAAHAQRIVHRDLKPENVFIARSRRRGESLTVKVLDFGIAKTMESTRTAATVTSALGSPLFMAPEQATPGATIRASADVFAIGMIGFYCLTGRYYWRSAAIEPFNLQALLGEVLVHPMVPASHRAPEVGATAALPPGFDTWFARSTARDPMTRFPTATECVAAFDSMMESSQRPSTGSAPPGFGFGPTMSPPPSGTPFQPPPSNTPALGHMGTPPPVAPTAHMQPPPSAPGSFGAPVMAPPRQSTGRSTGCLVAIALSAVALMGLAGASVGIFVALGDDTPTVARSEPAVPTPAVPTPAVPTPAVPTPAVPTPAVPTPAVPTPADPAPLAPAPAPVDDRLEPTGREGTLLVNTMPWSTVYVDGRLVGRTPVHTQLRVGQRSVRMTHEAGESIEARVTITAGETTTITRRFASTATGPAGPGDSARQAPLPETPSRSSIGSAMQSVSPGVRACAGSNQGSVRVRATFRGTNGHATEATISGTSLPASVRACISGAVMRARVPPFRRATFSLTYPFRL